MFLGLNGSFNVLERKIYHEIEILWRSISVTKFSGLAKCSGVDDVVESIHFFYSIQGVN